MGLVSIGQMLSIVGAGLMAQSISKLFGNTQMAAWFGSIMTIFALALGIPMSQASDLWGRKWFLVFMIAGGFIGFIIISRAQNMATVVTGFAFLGLPFGAQPIYIAVVSEVVARKHRGLAQSTITIGASLGATMGLLVGGHELRHGVLENYRVYCYIAAGVFALATLSVLLAYNPPPREVQSALTTAEKLKSLDLIGVPLISVGLTLFVVGLQFYQNPYKFSDAHVLGPFIVGLVLIAAFALYEWRFTKAGICHHDLFQHRNFPIGMFALFVEGVAFYTVNSYFSFEASVIFQLDLFEAGFFFLVLFMSAIFFACIAGPTVDRLKATRVVIAIGFACLVIFNSIMAAVKTSVPKNNFYGYAIFAGAGLGSLLPSIFASAQLAVAGEQIGIATGLLVAMRTLGSAIGLTVNNAIFTGSLTDELPSKVAAAVIPLGFDPSMLGPFISALTSSDPVALMSLPGATPQVIQAGGQAVVEAYVKSFSGAWITAASFAALGLIRKFILQTL
jgi:MFS family permease